jgi:hypothetical protein
VKRSILKCKPQKALLFGVIVFTCFLFTLLTSSCVSADTSVIPSDNEPDIPFGIEVVNIVTDRTIFDDLQQVEDDSTIIVEAIPKKNLRQEVQTSYDYEFKKKCLKPALRIGKSK